MIKKVGGNNTRQGIICVPKHLIGCYVRVKPLSKEEEKELNDEVIALEKAKIELKKRAKAHSERLQELRVLRTPTTKKESSK